ncbi:uncharacterized protein [Cherax quadricarinatus]|uniref:uncharacterized protein n=1 Tax=Cherax quadricarinatus TaxID=27406 RepID=UPI00387E8A99
MNLANDPNIIVTTADKGGGVVILNTSDYNTKMMDLLNDQSTYEPISTQQWETLTKDFLYKTRQILKRTREGKKLLYLLPSNPKPAHMYGLPKTHKHNIPLRPITSGIGSAPHKLAGVLAKHLSCLLGTISPAHLKHSGDLLNRIRNLSIRNKKLSSLDVTSLFTKVPTKKAIEVLRRKVNQDLNLPLPPGDFVDLIELCVNFNCFSFYNKLYKQTYGMGMGSPISAVLANLYMEHLESEHFANIIPSSVTWLRYVDDVLVITRKRFDVRDLQARLNAVEPAIQFTLEEESYDKLPFLDVLIHKVDNNL